MLGTFGILNFGIGICLGFRAWNFVVEAELCSGGVYPRLTGGDDAGGTPCYFNILANMWLFKKGVCPIYWPVVCRCESDAFVIARDEIPRLRLRICSARRMTNMVPGSTLMMDSARAGAGLPA
jgi:hypothetical protein